jgi:hypothetical protein
VVGDLCVISEFPLGDDADLLAVGTVLVRSGPDDVFCDEKPDNLEFLVFAVMLSYCRRDRLLKIGKLFNILLETSPREASRTGR